MSSDVNAQQDWFLQSSCPVELPAFDELTTSKVEFDKFLADKLRQDGQAEAEAAPSEAPVNDDTITLVSATTSDEIRNLTEEIHLDPSTDASTQEEQGAKTPVEKPGQPFMDALLSHQDKKHKPDMENKMLTENGAIAFPSTTNPLVDLFSELDVVTSGPRLLELLEAAWRQNPLSTLKLIFTSRSIHLGQGDRTVFYRCAGWLAQKHPLTLVTNLRWLCRPVIEKKAPKKTEDGDFVMVESEFADDDDAKHNVRFGVSHGYWKDLLNILVLAVNNHFDPLHDPKEVLNSENSWSRSKNGKKLKSRVQRKVIQVDQDGEAKNEESSEKAKRKPSTDPASAKEARQETRRKRHEAALNALEHSPLYLALHLTIARLFAEQLKADIKALRGTDAKAKKNISLCGKWAPSHDRFHDRHTFVLSSIAEVMYPRASFDNVLSVSDSRETYLRHAREKYRKDISALRKHLGIVERDISAGTFDQIKYDRLPSTAMKNNVPVFIEKDFERFEEYLDKVASGKAKISGATLLPSEIMRLIKNCSDELTAENMKHLTPAQIVEQKTKWLQSRALDGQWNALVKRIKDSGTLSSSIAVCDVSGSMSSPRFADGTCPMDSAIGLSLLVAEVTEPPFGGTFISFSDNPLIITLDLAQPLVRKYNTIATSDWGYNTDFMAVFDLLLRRIALPNKLKPEDMVKRIFVFSDMQFDEAGTGKVWGDTAYETIQRKYKEAGYEVPELIFWNLAGGRAGYGTGDPLGDPTAPKPVLASQPGTSLVSGYSQAMLKVFLEGGSFDEEEDEEEDEEAEVDVKEDSDGENVVVKKRKAGTDPTATMEKAIGHKAYDMLRVMD